MDEEKAKAEKVAAAKKKVQHSLPLPFHCHSNLPCAYGSR